MTLTNIRRSLVSLAAAAAASLALGVSRQAVAVPVTGLFLEDPRCDVLPNLTLTHELGEVQFFPLNEAFSWQVQPATFTVCVPDDGIANDWIVEIRNISGIAWQDLHFVADLGMTVGNADGNGIDVIGAPGVTTDAFRIDGTVTAGINNNLLFESAGINEIFEPGESWRFNVSNFMDPAGLAPPPIFRAPGVFAGSELYPNPVSSTASILANPVPEPTALGAVGIAAASLLARRRTR